MLTGTRLISSAGTSVSPRRVYTKAAAMELGSEVCSASLARLSERCRWRPLTSTSIAMGAHAEVFGFERDFLQGAHIRRGVAATLSLIKSRINKGKLWTS